MRSLLLVAVICSVLLLVCGQEDEEWKKMKTGSRSRSFRNRNTESADNADGVPKSPSNRGRRPMFRQQGSGQWGRQDAAQNATRGKGQWQRSSGKRANDWTDYVKAYWNTSVSGEIQVNEKGFIFEKKQMGMLMSLDPLLASAGYNQSFAMFDFNTGKVGIRVEIQELQTNTVPKNNDRKSREFWARKKHLCFIMDVPITIQDLSQELQLRSSSSTTGPIPTGIVKTFVARQANRVADLGSSGVIGRLCRAAAARGMAFSLVADSVTEPMEKVMVTGQIDPLQPMTSVPYEIKLEPGILVS